MTLIIKKKILHIHYSGIVRNKILLNYLLRYEKIYLDKNGSAHLSIFSDW